MTVQKISSFLFIIFNDYFIVILRMTVNTIVKNSITFNRDQEDIVTKEGKSRYCFYRFITKEAKSRCCFCE